MACGLTLSPFVVLRAAAWPAETIEAFAEPGLVADLQRVSECEGRITAARDALEGALFEAIPRVDDVAVRRWLLGVRRTIHQGVQPWPEPDETLRTDLARAGLSETLAREQHARSALLASVRAAVARHEDVLVRQRHALRDLASGAVFCRALAFANPTLAARWLRHREARRSGSPSSRSERQLDQALLRYVARAVGRTTPSGAWGGVSVVGSCKSARLRVTAVNVRRRAVPDLRAFRRVVEHLRRTPAIVRALPLHIDPAAAFDGERWRAFSASGEATCVESDAFVATLTDNYADRQVRPAGPLIHVLASRSAAPNALRHRLWAAVERLVEAGVLQSSLAFDPAPPGAWQAIDSAGDQLPAPWKEPWLSAARCFRTVCDEIDRHFDELAPAWMVQSQHELRQSLLSLYEAVGLDEQLPSGLLQMDSTTPYILDLPDTWREGLRQAAVDVIGLHARAGAAEAFRSHRLGFLRGERMALLDLVNLQHTFDGQAARAAEAAWEHWVRTGLDVASRQPGPSGTLAFGISQEVESMWFRWGRPQADFATFRLGEILGHVPDASPVAGTAEGDAADIEVVGIDALNPNAAVRDAGVTARIGRHSAGVAPLRYWSADIDAEGRGWLVDSCLDRPAAPQARWRPVYSSAAGIGTTDQVGRLLLRMAMSHGWEYLAFGFPVPVSCGQCDDSALLPAPHVAGALQAPAWTVPQKVVHELRKVSGFERYARWQQLLREAAVGPWAWVGPGGHTVDRQILLRTDSPLMFECVVAPLCEEYDVLVLTRPPVAPAHWLEAPDGLHYLAEMAVTWYMGDD